VIRPFCNTRFPRYSATVRPSIRPIRRRERKKKKKKNREPFTKEPEGEERKIKDKGRKDEK